jgi:predicted dehydrogenase
MTEPVRIGVVGTGSLGRHHVRILASLAEADLVGIYDLRPEVAAALAEDHGTTSCRSLDELLDMAEAVVVAVPTTEHRTVGCRALESGLHVLVEKPIARDLDEADALLAAAGDRILAVGHVEYYNPAVRAFLDLGETPRFVVAERLSSFTPRSLDVDVLLDLMIHDVQIVHAMDPSPIKEVRATGVEVLSDRIDIANARIELASGLVASLTASRVSAEPTRKLRIFGHHRYCSIDYREQEIKGFGLDGDGTERRIRPLEVSVERVEPLRAELVAFLAACRGRDVAYADGRQGRRALETALAVRQAIG